MTGSPNADASPHRGGSSEHAQTNALLSEIWMLVDYIAGSSSQGLNRVQVANPSAPGTNLTPAELLQTVTDTERRLSRGEPLQTYDRAEMQIVRDSLNLLIRPASGLTVAYTTMVSGPLRLKAASRFSLAQEAYENLGIRALHHRRLTTFILVLAMLVTGLAVWESAKVALGKALLQNLDLLRTQQAGLNVEKIKLELLLASPEQTKERMAALTKQLDIPLASYRLCDRALVLSDAQSREVPHEQSRPISPTFLAYSTAEERDICGRDDILRVNLGIVHKDLRNYNENWPGMVGGGFAIIRNLVTCLRLSCPDSAATPLTAAQQDLEFMVAPLLLVRGNFVLPIIFSFIGSAIFVTLDHYNKIRDSLLHPRDYSLAPVRLALGLVVGACVGLFFSAYGPAPNVSPAAGTGNLISSLTLTASGVAFLAGFGVETVFSMLEALMARLFTAPAAQK